MKPFMSKRISLADVARSTGLGVSTVSMALRNVGTISPKTQKRIQEAARTLGYYPNPLLATLASKHFDSKYSSGVPVAYLDYPGGNRELHFITAPIINAVQEHGRKLGYRVERFTLDDFKDGAHATQILFSRGFQGIILPSHFQLNMLPGMDWNRFSVVAWGEGVAESPDCPHPLLYRATVDHFGLVLRAWNEAWKRGYRRIGFALFGDSITEKDDQLRIGASQFCLQSVPPRYRVPTCFVKNFDSRTMAKWIRRYRPDAVIGFNGFMAWALRHEGFRMPEDFGLALLHKGSDDSPPETRTSESGMMEMNEKSVLVALELLDQQIRHHQCGLSTEPRTISINSEWIDGDTLPPKTEILKKRELRSRHRSTFVALPKIAA
jgi:LacI family transcriptional regulator